MIKFCVIIGVVLSFYSLLLWQLLFNDVELCVLLLLIRVWFLELKVVVACVIVTFYVIVIVIIDIDIYIGVDIDNTIENSHHL